MRQILLLAVAFFCGTRRIGRNISTAICFLNNVMRSALDFHISLGNILPHDSHAEKLNSTDKRNNTHERRPSCNRITEHKRTDYFYYNRNKRQHGEQQSEIGRNPDRGIGKINDSVKRLAHQLPETPLCFPCRPLHILKLQPLCLISDPRKDSL